ncbi:MAG: hypothetical protein H6584_05135 [Flavobacteriales bacterium]|nr:hypothetical protein [Flavobacteriales bacterium]
MKAASAKEIKDELKHSSQQELVDLCLHLSRFKKENKELLTYLLFEAHDEEAFIEGVKSEIDEWFEAINTSSYFFIRKSVRKILSQIKKHIRYSKKTETEIELLLYFCVKLKELKPSYKNNKVLVNTFERQLVLVQKKMASLHEDLQYDYLQELSHLKR